MQAAEALIVKIARDILTVQPDGPAFFIGQVELAALAGTLADLPAASAAHKGFAGREQLLDGFLIGIEIVALH